MDTITQGYGYTYQNPINWVDPNGKQIHAVYNKSNRTLFVTDSKGWDKSKPYKVVSSAQYKSNGVRNSNGNVIYNQVLKIENVFTGGNSRGENGVVTRSLTDSRQNPIPNGKYSIQEFGADNQHYRLDSQDSSPNDDIDSGTGRGQFRLHPGSLSFGCITLNNKDGESDKELDWSVLSNMIDNTTSTIVPKKEGYIQPIKTFISPNNPDNQRRNYGDLKVIGTDNIPIN